MKRLVKNYIKFCSLPVEYRNMPFVFRDVIPYLYIRNKGGILICEGFTWFYNPNPISDVLLTSLLISIRCHSNSVSFPIGKKIQEMQYLGEI